MQGYITRIAPSPTGDMHIGTARTAYFNWLAAKASGGVFILRIDDTDVERNKEEHVDVIYKTMDWLGLKPDITFRQSANTQLYKEFAEGLVAGKLATRLENGAIALKWNDAFPKMFHDEIAGDIAVTQTNIEQIDGRLILLRGGEKLGEPTYQFASVFDDWNSNVTYIIRGVDHLTNTPKQIAIWTALNLITTKSMGWPLPKFAHLGLIFKDKKKMSKRDGASSMLGYMEKNYDPDAVLNFMLRCGWGPAVDDATTSLIDRVAACRLFLTGGRMRNSQCNFDAAKLDSFDRKYKAMKKKAA